MLGNLMRLSTWFNVESYAVQSHYKGKLQETMEYSNSWHTRENNLKILNFQWHGYHPCYTK